MMTKEKGFCHRDDFCVLGSRKALLDFDAILTKAFDVKCMGIIGYAEDQKEVQVLNRTIRVVSDKGHVELEPDSRLVKKILDNYNWHGAKPVPTPRVKRPPEEYHDAETSSLLEGIEATRYRSATMRDSYLEPDRIDISECVKT